MLKELISNWEVRLTKAQVGHYLASERYLFWHNIIGSLLVMFSAFVASSLFLESQVGMIKYIIILASILCTILAGVQTLIRPSEQAEVHRSKAVRYGVLRRKIELYLSSNYSDEMEKEFLDDVKTEWDNIADSSPLTPNSLRKKSAQILDLDLKDNLKITGAMKQK